MSHRLRKEESVRRPEIDLAIARANAASIENAATQTTFVIDPLSTIGANVYNTFAQAVATASVVSGPKTFEFRGTTPVIAAGTYALGVDPVTITGQVGNVGGSFSDTPPILSIATGTTFTGSAIGSIYVRDLTVLFAGAAPAIIAPANNQLRFFNSTIHTTGGAPFVRSPAGVVLSVYLEEFCTLLSGTCFDAVGAGSFGLIYIADGATIGANTLAQSAGGTIFVAVDSPSVAVNVTQAGIPGGLTTATNLFLNSSASFTGYIPASNANWNNSPPDSVAIALDRIAAKITPVT